jgi:nucleotide-binding universal stress UspA family protein
MFKKILLPLDGSALAERAIEPVETIASGSGAEVLLLRIVAAPLAAAPESGQAEESKALNESTARAKAYLEKVAARLAGKSVKSRILVASGEPYAGILRVAHKEDVDFIAMTTHGGTALERSLLGSTAERVVYTTKRPVFLVKPEKIHAARHIDEGDIFARSK